MQPSNGLEGLLAQALVPAIEERLDYDARKTRADSFRQELQKRGLDMDLIDFASVFDRSVALSNELFGAAISPTLVVADSDSWIESYIGRYTEKKLHTPKQAELLRSVLALTEGKIMPFLMPHSSYLLSLPEDEQRRVSFMLAAQAISPSLGYWASAAEKSPVEVVSYAVSGVVPDVLFLLNSLACTDDLDTSKVFINFDLFNTHNFNRLSKLRQQASDIGPEDIASVSKYRNGGAKHSTGHEVGHVQHLALGLTQGYGSSEVTQVFAHFLEMSKSYLESLAKQILPSYMPGLSYINSAAAIIRHFEDKVAHLFFSGSAQGADPKINEYFFRPLPQKARRVLLDYSAEVFASRLRHVFIESFADYVSLQIWKDDEEVRHYVKIEAERPAGSAYAKSGEDARETGKPLIAAAHSRFGREAFEILAKNPPKSFAELRQPEIYLQRVKT